MRSRWRVARGCDGGRRTRLAAARIVLWCNAHDQGVVAVVRLDGGLDGVAVLAPAIFLDVDARGELQAIQIAETADAAGGRDSRNL